MFVRRYTHRLNHALAAGRALGRVLYSITTRRSLTSQPGPPPFLCRFPTTKYDVIDASQLVEEERLPHYNRTEYYPMRIGHVFDDRYQVIAKLGYGTTSTVWLARDIKYASLLIMLIPWIANDKL